MNEKKVISKKKPIKKSVSINPSEPSAKKTNRKTRKMTKHEKYLAKRAEFIAKVFSLPENEQLAYKNMFKEQNDFIKSLEKAEIDPSQFPNDDIRQQLSQEDTDWFYPDDND